MRPIILTSCIVLVAVTAGCAEKSNSAAQTDAAPDSTFLNTASLFHAALERGDSAAVVSLLSPDLRVLEGGDVENHDEYLAHHLGADIEFSKAVSEQRSIVSRTLEGNTAWIISKSVATGTFRGRSVDSNGAELMILGRTPTGWHIRAVHWSSARRTAKGS
jgi:ketosteroid isomerase-like protein